MTTKTLNALFNISISEELLNLMTIETHYKDQNVSLVPTIAQKQNQWQKFKEKQDKYLLV